MHSVLDLTNISAWQYEAWAQWSTRRQLLDGGVGNSYSREREGMLCMRSLTQLKYRVNGSEIEAGAKCWSWTRTCRGATSWRGLTLHHAKPLDSTFIFKTTEECWRLISDRKQEWQQVVSCAPLLRLKRKVRGNTTCMFLGLLSL